MAEEYSWTDLLEISRKTRSKLDFFFKHSQILKHCGY